MNKTIMLSALLLGSSTADARMIIYTPGQSTKVIQNTTGGYTINDLGGEGVTEVLDMGNLKMIMPANGPTTYMIGDTPASPVLPVAPDLNIDVPLTPGLPTGPNNEYEL